MRDKVFYAICFGFVFGIFLRSFLVIDLYLTILFSFIFFVLLLFFIFISRNKTGIILSVFLLVFFLGIFRFYLADKNTSDFFGLQENKKVQLSGIVIDEPDMRENNQKLTVQVKKAKFSEAESPDASTEAFREKEKTKILISTSFDQDFKYGDEINFLGKLEKPENFITDQGKEFDYINYLKKDGILYVMNYPKIEIISSNNGLWIKSFLFSIKDKFLEKMNMLIPDPENLLMNGLILGEKSSFSQSLRQSFVNTGTIHIVALSGYNVTIVAEWIMKLFSFLPKNFGIYMGILSIILFVLMTGGSSTAIRAGIMATLMLFARATGRNYDVARALILTAVIMILFNPFILVYDVSFQLSFIATVAVIFLAPKIEKYFSWITPKFALRDIISVTTAAYIFVMPFILYKMGNLSIVSLPANILILPFIPFTMLLGFLSGFLSFIWYLLAIPFGYVSYFFLHYELAVVKFFSDLPFSAFAIPDFPFLITILIYLYFIYRLFWKDIKNFFAC